MSTPRSAIARIANGWTNPAAREPADTASIASPWKAFASASAIWLRAALPVQRKSTRFIASEFIPSLRGGVRARNCASRREAVDDPVLRVGTQPVGEAVVHPVRSPLPELEQER